MKPPDDAPPAELAGLLDNLAEHVADLQECGIREIHCARLSGARRARRGC